jgi:hypothetical protein
MESMAIWEQVLLGAIVLMILFWFTPGIKATMKNSRQAETDWPGLLKPIAAVVLFIIILIMMA